MEQQELDAIVRLHGLYLAGLNGIRADLHDMDLVGVDLSEVNLRYAILYGADLRGATLRGANLEGTCLDPNAPIPPIPNEDITNAGLEIVGDRVYGWRTKCSVCVGTTTYEVWKEYVAPYFSVSSTECHPGIYMAGLDWVSRNYSGEKLMRVSCLRADLHHAGSKWRARRIFVEGEV